ncbi:MAG: hypothetical protein Q8R70_00290 [Methanoregula sp.]|nr:hypothetical protein [Methanoregula sp.]
MKNISFFATKEQFRDGSKDVTRRINWLNLNKGDVLMAVEKCQGIKPGELVRMGPIEITQVSREPLSDIITCPVRGPSCKPETTREGFPKISPHTFVEIFKEINPKCTDNTVITRIQFRKISRCAVNENGFCGPHPECPASRFDNAKDCGKGARLCHEITTFWESTS